MEMAWWLAQVCRLVLAILRRGERAPTSGWLSIVVAVELKERRMLEERVVVAVLFRLLMFGRGSRRNSAETASSVLKEISMVEFGELAMHGPDVHSSIGGRVVKFMHGASGPQRAGWQLSTCPAIRGQSFSPVVSVPTAMEMAMGSRVFIGGELSIESEAERAVERSLFVIFASSSVARELLFDRSSGEVVAPMLSSCEKEYCAP